MICLTKLRFALFGSRDPPTSTMEEPVHFNVDTLASRGEVTHYSLNISHPSTGCPRGLLISHQWLHNTPVPCSSLPIHEGARDWTTQRTMIWILWLQICFQICISFQDARFKCCSIYFTPRILVPLNFKFQIYIDSGTLLYSDMSSKMRRDKFPQNFTQ